MCVLTHKIILACFIIKWTRIYALYWIMYEPVKQFNEEIKY